MKTYTQKELAKRIGVSPRTIQNYFAGRWFHRKMSVLEIKDIVDNQLAKRVSETFYYSGIFDDIDKEPTEVFKTIEPEIPVKVKVDGKEVTITIKIIIDLD